MAARVDPALKVIQTNAEAVRKIRADMLMTMGGSFAAAEALQHVSMNHYSQAVRDADQELADHWLAVAEIFAEAKRKLGALT
jgi:hypothetical protein